jgi:hypothetical protein
MTVTILFAGLVLICLIIPASSFILLANAQTEDSSNTTTTTTRPNAVIQQQQWKTYTDEKLGISLKYPSTWEVIKQKTNNSRFESGAAVAAAELTIRGQVSEFYMIKAPVKSPDAEALAKLTKNSLTRRFNVTVIEDVKEHRYPIDGEKTFSFLIAQDSQYNHSIKIVNEALVVVHHGIGFGFGFRGVSTSFDKPEQVQIRDDILKSIKFLDVSGSSSNNMMKTKTSVLYFRFLW